MNSRLNKMLLAGFILNTSVAFAHGDKPAEPDTMPMSGEHMMHEKAMMPEQKPWGIAGSGSQAARTITLTMSDNMRFSPDVISVNEGETIRFKVGNAGLILHEMVIGTPKVLAEHAELMKKFPGMEHDEAYMTHVQAGETGEVVWTFNRSGSFAFACLIPGHFESGMRGTIQVLGKK